MKMNIFAENYNLANMLKKYRLKYSIKGLKAFHQAFVIKKQHQAK